jgi:4-hydroxybenzoyl-CoA thioesterase
MNRRAEPLGAESFVWRRRVAFGDCDPARIAYTGRIPEFALGAFWESILDGENWYRMTVDSGIGTPFVHMDFDFKAPVTPRALLHCHVKLVDVGATSVTFRVSGLQNDQERFTGRLVSVFVEAPGLRKIRIPERIRAALKEVEPRLS